MACPRKGYLDKALPKAVPRVTLLVARGLDLPFTEPVRGTLATPWAENAASRFISPTPNVVSVPVVPRSVAELSNRDTTCVVLSEGNRCNSKAAAPATWGEEKDVPLTVVVPPPSAVVTILSPGATTNADAVSPARLLKEDIALLELTDPTANMRPLESNVTPRPLQSIVVLQFASRASNSASEPPELPAAATTIMPASTALCNAAALVVLAAMPLKLMLIILAPFAMAKSIPAAISELKKRPLSLIFTASKLELKATPCVSVSFLTAPIMPATLVPWPWVSCSPEEILPA